MHAELLFEARAELGEGPIWHARKQMLYWVDIMGKRVYAGTDLLAQLDDFTGCLAARKQGGFVLALGASIVDFDPAAAGRHVRATVIEPRNNRFNDGKCDPAGRFVVGTMDLRESEASGALYSLEGRAITKILGGVRISNGLTWSPDYQTFYYIDTPKREIQAFDYDLASGQIANGHVAISIPPALGWPDGMTSDVDGNLWVAMWGGAQVVKWDPYTAQLLEQISVPALQPSSCIFGGANMNELYVTSARTGLGKDDLRKYPLSGGLFRMKTKVTGMPTFEFCW